jgi:twitching motility protein PilT
MSVLDQIITQARTANTSDVHIAAGVPVRFRVDGQLVNATAQPLSMEDCEQLARLALGDRYSELLQVGEVDLSGTYGENIRCRLNVYRAQDSDCLAIRLLAPKIPELGQLGLPDAVKRIPTLNKGIVLVTGETGSGKSTTLAAIIDQINHNQAAHVITLEDPIEYVYTPDRSSIDQREVGRDTASFANGLRAALRQDPDVVLVGEMRDLETIETALTAAETGHLVFGTLHTGSAADTIDRLVGVFPAERQQLVRMQLSTTLVNVLSQQLLPRREGKGRVCACEMMVVTPAIRNLIREGKTPQIANALATSADVGSITMDNMILRLYREQKISRDVAVSAAFDPEYVGKSIR